MVPIVTDFLNKDHNFSSSSEELLVENSRVIFFQNEKFEAAAAADPAPLAIDRDGLNPDLAPACLDPEQHGHVPLRLRRTSHGLLLVQQFLFVPDGSLNKSGKVAVRFKESDKLNP